MHRNTALRCVCSTVSYEVLHELGQSSGSGFRREPTRRLSGAEALISAVLLSLGLWALIWGAMCLLAA
jgi:hypothetical protein